MTPACSHCQSPYVKRAPAEGFIERLLGLVGLHPYRCQVCTHRFRARGGGTAQVPSEKREYERCEVNCRGWLTTDPAHPPVLDGDVLLTDLSMGGCKLETKVALAPQMVVRLQFLTWEDQPPLTVEAAVVRSVRTGTAGLEFLEFHQQDKQRLSHFVKGLLAVGRR